MLAQFSRILGLRKGMHYRVDWRYICAMMIGYARVSTDEQDTAAQVGRSRRLDASVSIARRPPAGGGTDRNFTGSGAGPQG